MTTADTTIAARRRQSGGRKAVITIEPFKDDPDPHCHI